MIKQARILISKLYSILTSNDDFKYIRNAMENLDNLPNRSEQFPILKKELQIDCEQTRKALNLFSDTIEQLDSRILKFKATIVREIEKNKTDYEKEEDRKNALLAERLRRKKKRKEATFLKKQRAIMGSNDAFLVITE